MKESIRIEFFNSKTRETGYIDAKDLLAVIPTKPNSHKSYQAYQLFNKEGELAKEVHIILSTIGYCLKPYFNEGKRLTPEERIKLLASELPEEILKDIQEHFKESNLIKILKGRKGIKTKRPDYEKDDELDYYIWRMTRFNCGIDTTMPVMAQMDITAYFSQKIEGKKSYFTYGNKSVKKAINLVDLLVDSMNFRKFGFRAFSGASIWAKALGIPL